MVLNIDININRLTHNADTVKNVVDIEFKNLYKYDKDFTYNILKNDKEVVVDYKGLRFAFETPIIKKDLIPIMSYLFFFKAQYTYEMIDTFKLEYTLAMYYIICLKTEYKNKTTIK